MPLDQMRLDGAKSELAYYTANSQSSLSKAANASFTNQALLGIPQSYQRDLLAKAKVSLICLGHLMDTDFKYRT